MAQAYFESKATATQNDMALLNGGTDYRTVSGSSTGYAFCGFNLKDFMGSKSRACRVTNIKVHFGGYCRSNKSLYSDSKTSVSYQYHFYINNNSGISGTTILYGEDYRGAATTEGITWFNGFTASSGSAGGWQGIQTFVDSYNDTLSDTDCWVCIRIKMGNNKSFSTKAYIFNVTFGVYYNSNYYADFIVDGVTHRQICESGTSPVYSGGTPTKAGHTFVGWYKNGTTYTGALPSSSEVDVAYTAVFEPITYTVTAAVLTEGTGTVSGGGAVQYGGSVTLTATPGDIYKFKQWNDGNTDNPRTVSNVTANATYTAEFTERRHVIISSTGEHYDISIEPTPAREGDTVTITCIPKDGYVFSNWNSSSLNYSEQNPIIYTIPIYAGDGIIGLYLQPNLYLPSYTVTVAVSPVGTGTVIGGGTFEYGTSVTLNAVANSGYKFVSWSDNNTVNPRTITVTSDISLIANFVKDSFSYIYTQLGNVTDIYRDSNNTRKKVIAVYDGDNKIFENN